jgi:hypothetical protein
MKYFSRKTENAETRQRFAFFAPLREKNFSFVQR